MKALRILLILCSFLYIAHVSAEDYYWVGGTGKWSDLNSWRTSTGEIPNEVPDDVDNVIFNEDSFNFPFDTVFILTGNPTCKNMIWENIADSVVIAGGSPTSVFSIHGSIQLHGKVINNYYGRISLLSNSTDNTITCDRARFAGDLWFEGTGVYTLMDTLFVLDTLTRGWNYVFHLDPDSIVEPVDPNPIIIQEKGTLDANQQTIVCRGFSTNGGFTRVLNIENSHIYCNGTWTLNAENLFFSAGNSYFLMKGTMNNLSGDVIIYNDIDFLPQNGAIKNTNIRSIHRKVHFLGSGTMDGKFTPGIEGIFVVDTLLFEGGFDPLTGAPIICKVNGPHHDIYYTQVNLVPGKFDVKWGDFHRIDFNGLYFFGPSVFTGKYNVSDSVMYNAADGYFSGENEIMNVAYFNKLGVVSSYDIVDSVKSDFNKIIFRSDGYMLGNNVIDSLILNTGYWYRIAADSLANGLPLQKYQQEVGYIVVDGGCTEGLARLTSGHKETLGNLMYTGNSLSTEYLMLEDINNSGGNILYIDNGIDGGNNYGVVFNSELEGRTLYWVGGGGNWTDETHWSLTPGATPGDQCPPTIRDDVYFNSLSGFGVEDTVYIDQKHAGVNDFMWEPVPNRPIVSGNDTSTLHIWGSVQLDKTMTFLYPGEVWFESEDDEFYETIDLRNKYMTDDGLIDISHLFNKVYFYGRGGKWKLYDESQYINYSDTTFLIEGELMLDNNEMHLKNFQAADTLTKGLYLLGESLVTLHQYQADAWNMRAYKVGEKTFFDAGHSTIISYGDITPPPLAPPGYCNIRSWDGELEYYNVAFSDPYVSGEGSMLKSESKNSFHFVDYHIELGEAVGTGIVNTMTFHKDVLIDGTDTTIVSADECKLRNSYEISYVYAESDRDTIFNNHIIGELYFKGNDGGLKGGNQVDYLQANQTVMINLMNTVGEAYLYGDAYIFGTNTFDKLVLSPNKRYTFQHWVGDNNPKFQTVNNDFIVWGNCDAPIRMNSDSIGTEARILYKALNPTHPNEMAKYASFRDIYMMPYESNEYIANSSINLGNNTNLTFTETNNDVYYWVGGQGRWGDWWHWSNESGGQPLSDQCTPREINTVIFDDNSFNTPNDTVKINVRNAYCKNMYWLNTENYKPTFTGNDTTVLYIYGSLELSDSLDYAYKGHLFFDQFEEPGDEPDVITTKGHVITSTIRFQGINDTIILGDNLTTVNQPDVEVPVYHEHGTVILNGHHMRVFSYESNYKNPRSLIMDNSKLSVYRMSGPDTTGMFRRAFWLNADNFDLSAENSELINEANSGAIYIKNGDFLKFNNIIVNGNTDSLANENNTVQYNLVRINNQGGLVTTIDTGFYIVDSVFMEGNSCYVFDRSQINYITLNGANCGINGTHIIKRAFVNKRGYITAAMGTNNEIEKCIFKADGYFRGENIFDTLVLYPGEGDFQNLGNKFTFESNRTQYIIDSLNVRGNQCSNITIQSNSSDLAYIQMVEGLGYPAVACDYLYIRNVAAESDAVEFYAGINSTALPDPNNPPPGWIFENAQGYIFGFDGKTDHFCYGDDYLIKTTSFNGGPSTLYFWDGASVPGGSTYRVTEPGTYHVRVEYFEGCYVDDYIKLEADLPPDAWIEPGPYCEGDLIPVNVLPDQNNYKYTWSTGDSTKKVRATLAMNDGGVYVSVLDTTNGCKSTPGQLVYVKPTPDPEAYLGPDVWIKYGQSVTIDAGPGDTWDWSTDPPDAVDLGSGREITVPGVEDSVKYIVTVTKDGCDSTGYKVVHMYPPSKLGIPTAFSPNDDGINDVFEILGSGFAEVDFRIYDRYGKLVFETTDPHITWDGTVNGKKQEQEVYTYYIRVVFQDKEVREETGNITLLR